MYGSDQPPIHPTSCSPLVNTSSPPTSAATNPTPRVARRQASGPPAWPWAYTSGCTDEGNGIDPESGPGALLVHSAGDCGGWVCMTADSTRATRGRRAGTSGRVFRNAAYG